MNLLIHAFALLQLNGLSRLEGNAHDQQQLPFKVVEHAHDSLVSLGLMGNSISNTVIISQAPCCPLSSVAMFCSDGDEQLLGGGPDVRVLCASTRKASRATAQ